MTITRNSRRALAWALAAGLAIALAAPLLEQPASAQSSTFGDKPECGSRFSDARFQYGLVTAELPSAAHPNSVLMSYDFGVASQWIFLPSFRFFYSTPAGPFALPRAEIFNSQRIKGSFEVPSIAGPHRIQISIGFWDNPKIDGFGYGVDCESNFVVAPFTTTTVFTQNTKKLVIPGGATPKNGSTAVLKSSVALAPVGLALTTTTTPTATTIAPTTTLVATTTTTTAVVATTVAPTTAPTATAATTPATTSPSTTAAPTQSSTVPPVTVAAAANSATKKAKAKRTVKKRKPTKKRTATTVKR